MISDSLQLILLHCSDTVSASGAVYTHAGVKIIGTVPMRVPVPTLPKLADAMAVLPTAMFAMFVGFIESIAVAKMYALANGCVLFMEVSYIIELS